MPLMKSATRCIEDTASCLRRKLELLEGLLELTRNAGRDPLNADHEEAAAFAHTVLVSIEEIQFLDRSLKGKRTKKGMPDAGEERIQRKIRETLNRLDMSHSEMMASIQAYQNVLGEKILRLKKNKDYLKALRPNVPNDPGMIDSSL